LLTIRWQGTAKAKRQCVQLLATARVAFGAPMASAIID
jgi:hypothetical protein